MDYEELQNALSIDKPEIVVREGEKVVGLVELAAMSADKLIDACKVTMRGDPVSIHRSEVVTGFGEKPTGRYGFGHSWRGVGSIPSEASPEVKNLSAFDCLREIYDSSKAYIEGEGWVV